jgi:hypothetical protein
MESLPIPVLRKENSTFRHNVQSDKISHIVVRCSPPSKPRIRVKAIAILGKSVETRETVATFIKTPCNLTKPLLMRGK